MQTNILLLATWCNKLCPIAYFWLTAKIRFVQYSCSLVLHHEKLGLILGDIGDHGCHLLYGVN